jgi:hypothetical protein
MQPEKHWEIKLAWSERKQGKWSSKRISSSSSSELLNLSYSSSEPEVSANTLNDAVFSFISSPIEWSKISPLALPIRLSKTLRIEKSEEDRARFHMTSRLSSDYSALEISIVKNLPEYPESDSDGVTFRFEGCNADPSVSFAFQSTDKVLGVSRFNMFFKEGDDDILYLPAPTYTGALEKTPGTYFLLPHADGKSIAFHPFFYKDDTRTFFVTPPKEQWPAPKVESEEETDPGYVGTYQPPDTTYKIPL